VNHDANARKASKPRAPGSLRKSVSIQAQWWWTPVATKKLMYSVTQYRRDVELARNSRSKAIKHHSRRVYPDVVSPQLNALIETGCLGPSSLQLARSVTNFGRDRQLPPVIVSGRRKEIRSRVPERSGADGEEFSLLVRWLHPGRYLSTAACDAPAFALLHAQPSWGQRIERAKG
jgi:hypothetical protein